jgi:hypothetical protein
VKSHTPLTRLQALGVLHRLYWAYLEDITIAEYEQRKALFGEAEEAIDILAFGILGKPTSPLQRPYLCNFCHEAYHERYVQIVGSAAHPCSCCGSCEARLLSEGKLVSSDGIRVSQQKGGKS